MPERLLYDEAMLFSQVRLKIQDADLKQGKVEMVMTQTNSGPVERPWGIEGGFAVVYKFRAASGAFRALRCFRVPMNPDTQLRYEHIGPYFHAHVRDITAGFYYHKEGILVKEQVQGKTQNQVYPIVEMDWIEGMTLVDKVDELCRKRDRDTLRDFGGQWLDIIRRLYKAQIAHGDLAGLNVMVRSNGQLALIDYDGVYIPYFANMAQILLGQPDYQHPKMAQRKFDEHMDAFSALVISIALLALSVQPELWDKYTKHNDQGKLLNTNMLFLQKDFVEPQQSTLFRDLERIPDPLVRQLVQELQDACQQNSDQLHFPFHLLDPAYEKKRMLAVLLEAIDTNDDAQIVKGWHTLLDDYPAAQPYRQRLQLAQQRIRALEAFQSALKKGILAQITGNYDPILDSSQQVTQTQRELLKLARLFMRAYKENDDDAFLTIFQNIQKQKGQRIVFTSQEQQRINRIQQYKKAQVLLYEALDSKNIERIVTTYTSVKNPRIELKEQQRQQIELASNFVQAYMLDDDDAVFAAYEAIQNFPQPDLLLFTEVQEQRVQMAQRRTEALARLRVALASKNMRNIAAAYDPILDTSKQLGLKERERTNLALAFVQAYTAQDDKELLDAYQALQNSFLRSSLPLTFEEQDCVTLAWSRQETYKQFKKALESKDCDQIVKGYDSVLDHQITLAESERLRLARAFIATRTENDEKHLIVYDEIQNSSYASFFRFSAEDLQSLETMRQRQELLKDFRDAVKKPTNAQQVVSHYEHLSEEIISFIASEERQIVEDCYAYIDQYQHFQKALRTRNTEEIWQIYQGIHLSPFLQLTIEERKYINRLAKERELQDALKEKKYALALNIARKFSYDERKKLSSRLRWELSRATRNLIKQYEMEEIDARIRTLRDGNALEVTCRWPEEEQINHAVILLHPWMAPQHPGEVSQLDPTWQQMNRRKADRVSTVSIPVDRRYTSIHTLVCTAMYDTWRDERQTGYYLSKGVGKLARLSNDTGWLHS